MHPSFKLILASLFVLPVIAAADGLAAVADLKGCTNAAIAAVIAAGCSAWKILRPIATPAAPASRDARIISSMPSSSQSSRKRFGGIQRQNFIVLNPQERASSMSRRNRVSSG